uniref:Phospholipase A2 n=1 Tax=Culicoides sonorensis TaxID=179676 RepID=A0A336LL42_CULSO
MRTVTDTSTSRLKKIIFFLINFAFITLLIASTAGAKPTLPFNLGEALQFPSLTSFTPFQQYVEKRQATEIKPFSGRRIDSSSLRMVYYHDLTVSVVELGPAKLLLNCELIEVFSDSELKSMLRKLSKINRPLEIGFKDMIKLMYQCELIDKADEKSNQYSDNSAESQNDQAIQESRSTFFNNQAFPSISLLSGIIPGTKWCGTGDIAKDYHDLGSETHVDRCCRTHDLCPSKVRPYQKRYELENNSLYTKSHCTCDDMLFSCLKHSNSSAGNLLGTIYFNLVQVPCIHESSKGGYRFRKARTGF